jgi:CheY-like chemotaxis protein
MHKQPTEQTPKQRQRQAPGRRKAGGLSVLLAEDTPANQKLIREILARRGHRVQAFSNGRDAVREFERTPYDVVVLDLQLPGLNGLRAAAAIRASVCGRADVPIVAMTAHAMGGDRERCLSAGMNGYLAKPIDAAELVRVVEHLAGVVPDAERKDAAPSAAPGDRPADVTAPAGGPLLDLDSARHRMGESEDLLRDMARFLIEDSPALLQALVAAVAAEDRNQSERAAHSLRGLAANFGAARCLSVATQIESDCRDGVFEPVQRDLATLRREFQALIAAVEREVLR